MNRVFDLLSKLPTTNSRIAVTLLLYIATGVVTMATGAFPGGYTWGAVLIVMAGLDATQFIGKRQTAWKPEAPNGQTN
jgi:hypothetical protein